MLLQACCMLLTDTKPVLFFFELPGLAVQEFATFHFSVTALAKGEYVHIHSPEARQKT